MKDTQKWKRLRLNLENPSHREICDSALHRTTNRVSRFQDVYVTSAATAFLDNSSSHTTGTDRSIRSYQQYLDSVAHKIEDDKGVRYQESQYSSSVLSSSRRWSPDIPDDERIIELVDDAGGEIADASSDSEVKDPRAPTLAKILNHDNELAKIVKVKDSISA